MQRNSFFLGTFFLNLFTVTALLHLPATSHGMTVMLDPGHGGGDKGANYGKAKEADLVLSVAQQLQSLLKKDPQFQVHMTRTQDEALTLPARVAKAESIGADLFISLHANAALDSRAMGAEFFFQNSVPPDQESLFLAHQENQLFQEQIEQETSESGAPSKKADVDAILKDLQRQNRLHSSYKFTHELTQAWSQNQGGRATIKQAPFYVISNTKMPSVLVEIGFLSNPEEARRLMRAEYQSELAQKIYKAVLAYKEKVDNPTKRTLD